MKRSDILRKLNNINMQIGRLMEETPAFAKSMRVHAISKFNSDLKGIAADLISKRDIDNEEIANTVAFGFENELKQNMESYLENHTRKEDSDIKRFKEVMNRINKMKQKRDAMAGDLQKQINERQKAGYDENYRQTKAKGEEDEKNLKQSLNDASKSRQSCIINALIWFAIAIGIAIFFGPAIVKQIREAGKAIMSKGLMAWDTIKECLKACLGVAVIAAPIIIGIVELLEIRNFTDSKISEIHIDVSKSNKVDSDEIFRRVEQDVLGICENFINKLEEE